MNIGGSTRVYALLGDPVAHSLSPVMQNAAFRALGLDAVYVAFRCEEAALPQLMLTLARQGGGGNVTIPHKAAAARILARLGVEVGPVCNTFWSENGKLQGSETDSDAILAALTRLGVPEGNWMVLGTGGSAVAAIRAARRAGAKVIVRSRRVERAREFAAFATAEGVMVAEDGACALVLNCTPLGLQEGDALPLMPSQAQPESVVLDLVYRRGETAWVRAMRQAGHTAADGREVLLEQGAAAFERWFPGRAAPREVMRASLRSALD